MKKSNYAWCVKQLNFLKTNMVNFNAQDMVSKQVVTTVRCICDCDTSDFDRRALLYDFINNNISFKKVLTKMIDYYKNSVEMV